jgi:hypothetical protein
MLQTTIISLTFPSTTRSSKTHFTLKYCAQKCKEIFLMHATCLSKPPGFLIIAVFREEYNFLSCSLCNHLHPNHFLPLKKHYNVARPQPTCVKCHASGLTLSPVQCRCSGISAHELLLQGSRQVPDWLLAVCTHRLTELSKLRGRQLYSYSTSQTGPSIYVLVFLVVVYPNNPSKSEAVCNIS